MLYFGVESRECPLEVNMIIEILKSLSYISLIFFFFLGGGGGWGQKGERKKVKDKN